jgi:probable rRNA maturation factor
LKLKLELQNKTNCNFADEKLLTKIGRQVLKVFGQKNAQIGLTVFYVDEKEIKDINKNYRNKDKETDVISFRLIQNPENLPLTKNNFPLDFDPSTKTIYLGEIFICEEVAKKQAKEFENSPFREGVELFVHGMLHILGCDHHEEKETKIMKNFEEQMITFLNKQKIM